MKDRTPTPTFEERWLQRLSLGRCPKWLQGLLLLWMLLSLMFVALDDLRANVPNWFGLFMITPYILLVLAFAPALVAMQLRWISWPFRSLFRVGKKLLRP